MKYILGFVAIAVYYATGMLLGLIESVVISLGWEWFAVPLGAPEIPLAHVFGLAIVISLLTIATPHSDKEQGFLDALAEGFGRQVSCLIRVGFAALGLLIVSQWAIGA